MQVSHPGGSKKAGNPAKRSVGVGTSTVTAKRIAGIGNVDNVTPVECGLGAVSHITEAQEGGMIRWCESDAR